MKRFFIAILLVTAVACTSQNTTTATQYHYHDDGQAKPQVAIVPIYDRTNAKMPWNLSMELSEALNEKIAATGRFFLTRDFDMLGLAHLRTSDINPFLDDISWIGEVQTGTEFIVFVELVEHKLIPNGDGESVMKMKLFQSYNLDMTMRVKVIDIRKKMPRVILQEIIEDNYYIPWRLKSINYTKGGWSKTAFSLSPIGMAHGKMVKKITSQVEEYIILAKMH